MSSDNVELLSYTSNLAAGASFTSDPVILGQYISLSILAAASEDITIAIQFSADGVNYDYSVTRNILVGDNTLFSHPVSAKWTRVRITNNGLALTTYLRVYVYGVPSNSSLSAQISKIGNLDPVVDVGNLPLGAFGELMVIEDTPQSQYMFAVGTSGLLNTSTWKLPYTDVKSFASFAAPVTISNGVLSFGPTFTSGDYGYFRGATHKYNPGQGIESKFTAFFLQGVKNGAGPNWATEYVGIGSIDSATNKPKDGYFFGYGDPTLAPADGMGIVYINNGVRTFYPRTSWNVDKADGTNILPALDFSKFQVFEITYQYLGFGMVRFYVESPTTGLPVLVHTINRVNIVTSPTNLSNPSLGLLMYVEIEAGSISDTPNQIGCASFTYTNQGKLSVPQERLGVAGSKLGVTTEAAVLNIRNDATFYARDNVYPLDIDYISSSSDGTKSVVFKVYRNCTLAGAVWTAANADIMPVSYDTVATISAFGTFLFGWNLAKIDNLQQYLSDMNIQLNPGDIITITAASTASTDIDMTASVIYH